MYNVYKSYSKRWRNCTRQYALDVWRNRADEKTDMRFRKQADLFSREYRNSLEQHYKRIGLNVYRGTISGKVDEWKNRQLAIQETIKSMATDRKSQLVADEIKRIESDETIDLQESINKVYALKKDENVYKVFSFAEHFEGAADRIGDDEAFALGRDINEAAIKESSDRYFWRVQQDNRVRKTHLMLADKCFLWSDPPTTIDRYGRSFTGNPGMDYGCRCWAEPAPVRTKAKLNYVVKEK